MDNSPADITVNPSDDFVAASSIAEPESSASDGQTSSTLLSRIGTAKVYLLPDTTSHSATKRKRDSEDGTDEPMSEELSLRRNALFLNGTPISHLPTARIFAYATHFDVQPMGLEWVNDDSCILVFDSRNAAREAFRAFAKMASEDVDVEGFVNAKSIPVTLWPPEERITQSLGKGEGLKGLVRMRWAKIDDVKKKGSREDSCFYKKYGEKAGKEDGMGGARKRRRDDPAGTLQERLDLDNELDEFLAGDDLPDDVRPGANPLLSRLTEDPDSSSQHRSDHRRTRGDAQTSRRRRPPTHQDLDDELDAFLKQKD
ncbi:hypothetical protein CONPUDRAFT_103625 [Coniophora puteana RWD-64-598 SS2]|uniref:Chromatin target of PRMT1 protein C-terminal domain-containing protein n=1 Tax=Coniophora puteana (strain RWD-64-598) TaxID=741705 RepID=A0A5M3MTG5_CONPW|nr:uncharacterized protein CONPUDRAFT_103625 [Coniophora puteana RWD-64-598 SS2]EIW82452.1 hypothetical protein CONPUDRAFT_103625 [Coniophora puteana RWD-64-598 SS2]